MSAHTPEPWEMAFQECHTGGVATCHGNGGWFEVWSRHWGDGVNAPANAARIVACVNAMEGIEDPQAFVEAARAVATREDGTGEHFHTTHVSRKSWDALCVAVSFLPTDPQGATPRAEGLETPQEDNAP